MPFTRGCLIGLCSFVVARRCGYGVRLSLREKLRYYRKALFLSLCYDGLRGLLGPASPLQVAQAGALSALYDVVTDWRHFDHGLCDYFQAQVQVLAGDDCGAITRELLDRDRRNTLRLDGLERGALSLRCIGRFWSRAPSSATREGLLLQLVDDVLDWDEDKARGEQNAVASRRGPRYLRCLVASSPSFVNHFRPRSPLRMVIRVAVNRASRLLSSMETQNAGC